MTNIVRADVSLREPWGELRRAVLKGLLAAGSMRGPNHDR